MSYFSKINSMYNNELQINNPDGGDVDITSNTGQVKINGVVPSGAGGIVDPLNIGTLNASALITTPSIKPPDVNTPLFIEANVLKEPTAGPANLEVLCSGVTASGTIQTGNLLVDTTISCDGIGVTTGDVTLGTTSNLRINGTGKVIAGSQGIDSNGDINTIGNNDIISGRNIYFDGTDLFKRTIVGGVASDTSYKDFKQLAGKNEANTFNANQTFAENIIMSGTNKTITNNLGTFIGANSNIETMTCGTLVCSNGGSNKVSAKVFETRVPTDPVGLDGWIIQQEPESNPPSFIDNVLQIKQGVAGGYATITSTDFVGSLPNIVLNPRTLALGGQVVTNSLVIGEDATNKSFTIEQPRTGGDLEDLVIKAGNGNFAATRFQNNSGNDILRVENAKVLLPSAIPLSFNAYSFRPQQYTFNFSGATIDDGPGTMFNSSTSLWTNVNDGGPTQTLHTIGNNFFKMTIIGVPDNSAGVYGNFRWSGDFPFIIPSFSTGTSINRYDGNFSIASSPVGFTKPDLCGYSSTSTDYKLCFPSVPAGTDTYTGIIRITILNT